MHTIDAAYALDHDNTTGSIEIGKFADYVILDQNIFDIAVDDIGDIEVSLTVVSGTIVRQATDFSP